MIKLKKDKEIKSKLIYLGLVIGVTISALTAITLIKEPYNMKVMKTVDESKELPVYMLTKP